MFSPNVWLNSDRFHYHFGFQLLKYDATNDATGHIYYWLFHVYTDATWATFIVSPEIPSIKNGQTLLIDHPLYL